ncbi:MAG: M15 family metallopeptidase [Lachnospiraceae bacterium]|nr:M15 family metallopeptidase [Lachnospiraceae bacterium]
MKNTWRERQVSKCIKFGNKYRFFKPLMLLLIVFIVAIDRTRIAIYGSRKKILGVAIAFFVFLISNSFSTPVFQYQSVVALDQDEQESEEIENLENLQEESSEEETIEELQNLEIEGEVLTEEEDLYSVDEILQNTQMNQYIDNETDMTEGYEFSKEDWNLLLVNKQHPIPENHTVELGTIAGSMKCDARILPELFAMLQAAKNDGIYLSVCSPYRDLSRQEMLFNRKIRLYMGYGYSYMDAYIKASEYVMVPGSSEHQIGLALDIISNNYTSLDEGFEKTDAGKWLKEHCDEYGFILRYPKGKEHITGIGYEPWHFRYVGKAAATIIMDNEITLEEFVESISE